MMEQLIRRLASAERDVERLRTIDSKLTILPMAYYQAAAFPLAAGTYYPYAATLPRDGYIVRFICSFYVATTNNGGNYWTFTLQVVTTGATVQAMNTSAATASTWTRQSAAFEYAVTTADVGCQVSAASTGAPGVLYMAAPIVAMR